MFSCNPQISRLLIEILIEQIGVISAGVSVPVQIPSQGPELGSSYWARLQ